MWNFVQSDMALLASELYGLELLTQYGVTSFYIFLENKVENKDGKNSKLGPEIKKNIEMNNFYNEFKEMLESKFEKLVF